MGTSLSALPSSVSVWEEVLLNSISFFDHLVFCHKEELILCFFLFTVLQVNSIYEFSFKQKR